MFPDGLMVDLELEDSLPQFRSVSEDTSRLLHWLTLIRISTLAPVLVLNTGHELEYD